ncbi:MAG: hypothetical protein LH645_01285 [Actinomycetia bacterium]|nr:hypothetical protein [Actinomycetes bacterium]
MPPPAVHLHIGEPKTGTTYIQDVLWANREALRTDGVLLPGRRYDRVHATRDLLKWKPSDNAALPQSWERLTDEVNSWKRRSAVISQEFLCRMTSEQVAAIIECFPKSQVHAVLSVRDVARLVPAQWQTLMLSRGTLTLDEYADAAAGVGDGAKAQAMEEHFWLRHDSRPILQRWVAAVGLENVKVITVPPSGGDPDELWRRFCRATDLDATETKPGKVSHASLGAASAEVMRRLNARPEIKEMKTPEYQKSVNGALSRRVLGHRSGSEPSLVLPEAHRAWAEREASRLMQEIRAVGIEVVGDLEDLRPRVSKHEPVAPDKLPADELLEAAIDGLAGLAAEHAKLAAKSEKRNQPPKTGGNDGHTSTSPLRATYRRLRPRR